MVVVLFIVQQRYGLSGNFHEQAGVDCGIRSRAAEKRFGGFVRIADLCLRNDDMMAGLYRFEHVAAERLAQVRHAAGLDGTASDGSRLREALLAAICRKRMCVCGGR